MRIPVALTALLALGACASPGAGASVSSTYATELAALERDCVARNGFLNPIGNQGTGRPATDYACTIRGETLNRAGQ